MQAKENSGETRVLVELLRAMYPGKCGYKSNTGGVLKNLRESTDNTKVGYTAERKKKILSVNKKNIFPRFEIIIKNFIAQII